MVAAMARAATELTTWDLQLHFACVDYGVLDGVCLLVYANKLDLEMNHPLEVNEVCY